MLVRIYALLFAFTPVPIFIDLSDLRLILSKDFAIEVGIPLPLGAITLVGAFLVGLFASTLKQGSFLTTFTPLSLLVGHLFLTLPFGIIMVAGLELSVPRTLQVILPLILLSLVTFPRSGPDQYRVLHLFMLSAISIGLIHLISIIKSAGALTDIHVWWDFSFIFGWVLYQALVSYSASLVFFMLLGITVLFGGRAKKSRRVTLFSVPLFLSIPLFLFLIAASQRRTLLLELAGAALIATFLAAGSVVKDPRVSRRNILASVLMIALILPVAFITAEIGLFTRFYDWLSGVTPRFSREVMHSEAMDLFLQNPSLLLFGGGLADRPGFHNYFFDQIYRIGVFGLLIIITGAVLLVKRIKRVMERSSEFSYQRVVFLAMFLAPVVFQSTINSSFTQPYYFINFFAVIFLVAFVVFRLPEK